MRVGVLAVQGAFAEHAAVLDKLGVSHFGIRQKRDLDQPMNGLIIPGGESTVMSKLLDDLGMRSKVLEYATDGVPVFGTCAGLILMSKETGDPRCTGLGLIDCTAKRNAYGRQLGSFHTDSEFKGIGTVPMTFIRAPYISSVGESVDVLAEVDSKIVAARQGNQLATAFHPELDNDLRIHEYFVNMINNR